MLPADNHHREAKGETASSLASVAPGAKKVPEKIPTQKSMHSDEKNNVDAKITEKGPSHGTISVSDIALGISAMNGHVTENTNDCDHKGGIATLWCHKSKAHFNNKNTKPRSI